MKISRINGAIFDIYRQPVVFTREMC